MSSQPKRPSYIDVDGFCLPVAFYPPAFRAAVQYKPKEDDIFLATYPKCGTTWMQYILYLLYNKGEKPESFETLLHFCPHIEMMGVEAVEAMKRPGVIKTHLPYDLAPHSSTAKYIWVIRNPKDCCISFYHHTECTGGMYDFEGGDFNDYFELFIKGEVDFGDYFDHVLSWYNRRNDGNVLMIAYEEMKTDIETVIWRVVEFLGDSYGYDLKEEKDVFESIVTNCSLSNMKIDTEYLISNIWRLDLLNPLSLLKLWRMPGLLHMIGVLFKHKSVFNFRYKIVRKGIVGDWRNVFTPEQNQRMNDKIEEKLGGTEILKLWKYFGAI